MANNENNRMYQISTLQALLLGYTRGVITVGELADRGKIGLGTFENVNGEMIVLDGEVYRADNQGQVTLAPPEEGVPFASVADVSEGTDFVIEEMESIEQLKQVLDNAVEEDFGLNSMYVVRIDGCFQEVRARSEEGQRSHHVALSEILQKNQRDFDFYDVQGTMVCLYYPDYMDGINAPGWHLHFLSENRQHGGHVYDLKFKKAQARRSKMYQIEIRLPADAAFDTYSLKSLPEEEVKKVEQSSK